MLSNISNYMKSIRRYLDKFTRWLWERNERTKTYLRLNAAKMVEDLDVGTEEEKSVARRAFADGGQKSDEGDAKGDEDSGDDEDNSPFDVGDDYGRRQRVGFVLGPVLFALIFLAPTPEGLAPEGQAVAAVTAWVAVWWISEAIPIPATPLLPVVLFPLTGALPVAETTPSYAHPLVFLFMGGFFLAMAMQRWNLHRRIALRTIKYVGTEPSRLILGFMIATAFLSMWVSNTATVMMMVPIALAVVYQTADLLEDADTDIETEEGEFRFGVALMLCIAYGASVGGVATLIGTPPNILFAGQAAELFGDSITFFEWMLYGVPVAVVGIATVYVYVTRLAVAPRFEAVPAGDRVIDEELESLGRMSRQERLVLVVFAGMATAWIGSSLVRQANLIPVPEDIDTVIAILGALVLFTVPTRTEDGEHTFLLDWTSGVKIPWGVILLFGGGLAIAAGFGETGLAAWIGERLGLLEGVSVLVVLLAVVTMTIFLTEVTSNTATTAMLMPILAGVGIGIGIHPYGLMIAGATAASFAFMLPVATPPNAIVFGSGYITIPQMARVGFGLNVLGVLLITLVALFWLPFAWGIEVTNVPQELVNAFGVVLK